MPPRSAAARGPVPAAGRCWPVTPQETLKHSKVGLVQSLQGLWVLVWLHPSYHLVGASPLPLDMGYFFFFLVGSNILLSVVVQQWAEIFEFSWEKMREHPSTPPSLCNVDMSTHGFLFTCLFSLFRMHWVSWTWGFKSFINSQSLFLQLLSLSNSPSSSSNFFRNMLECTTLACVPLNFIFPIYFPLCSILDNVLRSVFLFSNYLAISNLLFKPSLPVTG